MLTAFQWFCVVAILAACLAGAYYPLFRPAQARAAGGFPLGQAFTAGIFIAMALTLMLPSSIHLLHSEFPKLDFPISSAIALAAFFCLLGLEQFSHRVERSLPAGEDQLSPPLLPLIMMAMIAIPSFFLGTALGVSSTGAAVLIFIAIIIHKSSAAFALALRMVWSTMASWQVWVAFGAFAMSTPLGIVAGQEVHNALGTNTLNIVKGFILALAGGTFLYMATLHEFGRAPMIVYCNNRKGFAALLVGFAFTALVRFLIGEAHLVG